MAVTIRLSWEKDPEGYEVEERPDRSLPEEPGESLLSAASKRFDLEGGTYVVSRSKERQPYWHDIDKPHIFTKFASIRIENDAHAKEDSIAFIEAWGFLRRHTPIRGCRLKDEFYPWVAHFKRIIGLIEDKHWKDVSQYIEAFGNIGKCSVAFARKPQGSSPLLTFQAEDLLDYMWLEMMQEVGHGTKIRRCVRCGKVMSLGSETNQNAKRTYCSNSCRTAAYRARKVK